MPIKLIRPDPAGSATPNFYNLKYLKKNQFTNTHSDTLGSGFTSNYQLNPDMDSFE